MERKPYTEEEIRAMYRRTDEVNAESERLTKLDGQPRGIIGFAIGWPIGPSPEEAEIIERIEAERREECQKKFAAECERRFLEVMGLFESNLRSTAKRGIKMWRRSGSVKQRRGKAK